MDENTNESTNTGSFSMPKDPASAEENNVTEVPAENNPAETVEHTESTAPVTEPITSYDTPKEYTAFENNQTTFTENNNDSYSNSGSYSAAPGDTTTYNPYSSSANVNPNQTNNFSTGFAIASLVLGIVGILFSCCCPFLGIILAIVGIIMGCIQAKDPVTDKKPGYAVAGIICSSVGIVFNIIFTILWILMFTI